MIGKVYLVGGAVRDLLLGVSSNDRDWVVVGSSPAELLLDGFTAVGADFPVFLHPDTHDEYALARTEKKSGKGHTGFDVYFHPSVTLEEDLSRRDLTINAMAQDSSGSIIDPYGGQSDIQSKYLRHVGPAFSDDPLRILRVARFGAKFPSFSVHPSTLSLMQTMVSSGVLSEISGERLFKECCKAFQTSEPWQFFKILHDVGADEIVFGGACDVQSIQHFMSKPGVSSLSMEWKMAIAFSNSGLSPARLESTTLRQKWPSDFSQALRLISLLGDSFSCADVNSPSILYSLAKQADAFRRPDRFAAFLHAINTQTPINAELIVNAVTAVKNLDLTEALKDVSNAQKFTVAETIKSECFCNQFKVSQPVSTRARPHV